MTIDGYTVPSDIQVEVPLYILHHHPDIWEDPEVCIAKRAKRNRYLNYNPQRSCGKVMFLHVSVILSTLGVWQADIPLMGRHPLPGRHTPLWQADTPSHGNCSGRYSSYWNAFLFLQVVTVCGNCD